ncbi:MULTISPECIES: TolC family protein [Niastella]|uniref:TolC family protein n=1 Tax=Niastella soli TaxID=2821487 RepID=A0ABS3YQR0_9BACT|nr:TolC family protein [Niastella soli]MBO9200251.1 TolC family protein [Niastella soli]
MKKSKYLLLLFICYLPFGLYAQDKWDLRRCVEYALANNLTVQQTSLQAHSAEINEKQARWSQYPNVDFSTSTGLQWGRSIDYTTNLYTSNENLYQTYGLQAGITVFNWHRIRNNIIAADLSSDAAHMDVEKTKNDISLNVATYYLQVLLSRQQIQIASVQMNQTKEQWEVAKKRVAAGAAPELDALTLEGQYATDSSNYISARATADQNLLLLKQVLNIDAGQLFDIATPPVEQIPVEPILELQPNAVYQIALQNQPAQKSNALRIQSLEASLRASRAAMYPTISIGGSLNTQFSSASKFTTQQYRGDESTLAYVTDGGGIKRPVFSPAFDLTTSKKSFGDRWSGWGNQLNTNFRQSLGLSIAVPINSGGNARFNYQRSKLDLKNAELNKSIINQTLQSDIYKAYYNASAALEKFNATKRTFEVTQKSYDVAKKRYDVGLLNTFDLLISQNNMNRAQSEMTNAQFDYVFKLKVLEFYKGQGIKL